MELNCSRCLFASFALGFALQLTSCWSLCPGTNQICQSHESSRMKMKLFLICVIRIKNQFSTHTEKEAQSGYACAYGRVGRGGTTPYAGENKMAAGLLEAWGGMRHAACIFNVAPAVASMTNHDAWLAKSKCLPLAKESVCISNDSLRRLTPPSIKYDIYIDQSWFINITIDSARKLYKIIRVDKTYFLFLKFLRQVLNSLGKKWRRPFFLLWHHILCIKELRLPPSPYTFALPFDCEPRQMTADLAHFAPSQPADSCLWLAGWLASCLVWALAKCQAVLNAN